MLDFIDEEKKKNSKINILYVVSFLRNVYRLSWNYLSHIFLGKSIIFFSFSIIFDAPVRQGNGRGRVIAESAIVIMHCANDVMKRTILHRRQCRKSTNVSFVAKVFNVEKRERERK